MTSENAATSENGESGSVDDPGLALWWHVLRPDRLRCAAEIDALARRYRKKEYLGASASDALEDVARWLRASAGAASPNEKPPPPDLLKWFQGETAPREQTP